MLAFVPKKIMYQLRADVPKDSRIMRHRNTHLGFELRAYYFQEEAVLLLCSFDLASLACMSLSKIGGSNGVTSRHLSEAATITCSCKTHTTRSKEWMVRHRYSVIMGRKEKERFWSKSPHRVRSQLQLRPQLFLSKELSRTECLAESAGTRSC